MLWTEQNRGSNPSTCRALPLIFIGEMRRELLTSRAPHENARRAGRGRRRCASKLVQGRQGSRTEAMFSDLTHGGGPPASGGPSLTPTRLSLTPSSSLSGLLSAHHLYLHPALFPKLASHLCDSTDLLAGWGKGLGSASSEISLGNETQHPPSLSFLAYKMWAIRMLTWWGCVRFLASTVHCWKSRNA